MLVDTGRGWERRKDCPEFFENMDITQIPELFIKNVKN